MESKFHVGMEVKHLFKPWRDIIIGLPVLRQYNERIQQVELRERGLWTMSTFLDNWRPITEAKRERN